MYAKHDRTQRKKSGEENARKTDSGARGFSDQKPFSRRQLYMEQPNQWLTQMQKQEEEQVYMYQQEGGPVPLPLPGMEQQFITEPALAEHQEQPMATPSFNLSRSSNFTSFGGSSSFPNLPFGLVLVENELGQPSPPLSSNFLSFGTGQPTTMNFSGGACWQHDGVQGMMQQMQAPERRGSGRAPASAHEHVIAERKRREKLQQQFVSLATIIPGIKKTDKLSLLGSTIDYVKQLEQKVKALDEQGSQRSFLTGTAEGSQRSSESMAFDSKCRISSADNDAAGPSGSGYLSPDIEASIWGNTALLNIFCTGRKGVLVMVLSELENQGLSIINTNVVPFPDSGLNITITAKIEVAFPSAVQLVKNLKVALRSFS